MAANPNPYKPRSNTLMRAPGLEPPPAPSAGPGVMASRSLASGTTVLGRYTIQKVIGRGGMATVYLARNTETERLVALKILDPEISNDPSYVERFRREARAAGRIRSDNVVAIYDLGTDANGTLVLVMEYLEGQSVQQALRGGRMPIDRVLTLARQLCEGLAAAHECGVVHRDLKPANLFIEKSTTGSEKLKILDFGISKLAEASSQELTRAGQTLGTLAYMAPEQIRGTVKGPDGRIDLYSAGVSLFLMLTAKRPIDAEDTVQLLQAVLEKPPLTLQQAAGVEFPPQLEALIERALQKDPTRRFQTALEMRDALTQLAVNLDNAVEIGASTIMVAAPSIPGYNAPLEGPGDHRPPPTATPPSGVIVSAGAAVGPAGGMVLPAFEDDEEEGKTVVRAPAPMGPDEDASVLPAAGRRIDASLPAAGPNGRPSSPMRAPTMAPNGLASGSLPPVPPQPGARPSSPQRASTILGLPPAPSPGQGPPGAGAYPPGAAARDSHPGDPDLEGVSRTQAIEVFPDPAQYPSSPQLAGALPGMHPTQRPLDPSAFGPPMMVGAPSGSSSSLPTAAHPAAPPKKRSPVALLLGGATAVAVLLVGVAGFIAFGNQPQSPAPNTTTAVHAPATTPTPAAATAPAIAQPLAAPEATPSAPAPVAQALAPSPEPPANAAPPAAPTVAENSPPPASPPPAAPAAAPEAPPAQNAAPAPEVPRAASRPSSHDRAPSRTARVERPSSGPTRVQPPPPASPAPPAARPPRRGRRTGIVADVPF